MQSPNRAVDKRRNAAGLTYVACPAAGWEATAPRLGAFVRSGRPSSAHGEDFPITVPTRFRECNSEIFPPPEPYFPERWKGSRGDQLALFCRLTSLPKRSVVAIE